jgi:hypothetical protein
MGAGVNCGGVEEAEDSDDVADALDESGDAKADQIYSALAGKYTLYIADAMDADGMFESLNLSADKKYESILYCANCRVIPETGTWKRLRKGKRTYLRFTGKSAASTENTVTTYQYTDVTFDRLELRKVGTRAKFQIEREPDDCRRTGCDPGHTCRTCWYTYSCVPDGAVC